jgi:hypothetical protein
MYMAKRTVTAARTIGKAAATVSGAGRKAKQLAKQLAKNKRVVRARRQAAAVTKKAVDKVTGRARKRTRAKVAAAVVGAVATATVVGVGIARKRKR